MTVLRRRRDKKARPVVRGIRFSPFCEALNDVSGSYVILTSFFKIGGNALAWLVYLFGVVG
jgi:hypothetical protein